jgi:hypothetical protein
MALSRMAAAGFSRRTFSKVFRSVVGRTTAMIRRTGLSPWPRATKLSCLTDPHCLSEGRDVRMVRTFDPLDACAGFMAPLNTLAAVDFTVLIAVSATSHCFLIAVRLRSALTKTKYSNFD